MRRDAPLTFRWRAEGDGYQECCDVDARCTHAVERGVALPEHWRTALRCMTMGAHAEESARSACIREPGLKEIECAFLGQAKAPAGRAGQVVALQVNGSRVVYFL